MKYDKRHGGPYDRGSADFYYGRSYAPHYYVKEPYSSEQVNATDMTPDEIAAYTAGWEEETSTKNWD